MVFRNGVARLARFVRGAERRVRAAGRVLLETKPVRPIDPALVADLDDHRDAASARGPNDAPQGNVRARRQQLDDIFRKAYEFVTVERARSRGLYPYFRPFDLTDGGEAVIDGRRVLMLGSNNYLGLTTSERLRQTTREAIALHGTAAPPAGSDSEHHRALEAALARFVGKEAALVFASGYMANTATISALLNEPGTVAVLDKNVHASIYDGVRLAKARGTRMVRYRHNDPEALAGALAQLRDDERALVITDGVFSAEGELAPLPALIEVVEAHGARLMVDDAHGLGVVGPGGRGTSAHFGVSDRVDLISGTFSKSLASVGGWIAADRAVVEFVRHESTFRFASRLPVSCALTALGALTALEAEPFLVERLQRNFTYVRTELRSMGFDVGRTETAVVPIYVRKDLRTLLVWKELLEGHAVYTNPFISPGVPPNHAMLRTSYMATHTDAQLERGLAAFRAVGKKFGVVA